MTWRRGDTLVLAEADAEPAELTEYFGSGDRLPGLPNFLLNQQVFLGMGRRRGQRRSHRPLHDAGRPRDLQWATFLRNHDEIDLGRLTDYNQGVRGDRPRTRDAGVRSGDPAAPGTHAWWRSPPDRDAYSLQFALPATPVIRYGEEIGMGDELSGATRLGPDTRCSGRDGPNGVFSTAAAEAVHRPVISDGEFGYAEVNVTVQRRDAHSPLSWMERALHTLRECPEFAIGKFEPLDTKERSVVALRYTAPSGHAGPDQPGRRAVRSRPGRPAGRSAEPPTEVFGDGDYGDPRPDPSKLELNGYGYRWIRLGQSIGTDSDWVAP